MDVNIAVDYFGDEAVLKLGGHLNTNTAADLEEALELSLIHISEPTRH